MFEIKHLKTLLSLEQAGNVRKAAQALFISHSALSHQIKDLEHKLNSRLFIRNSHPIVFSDSGLMLIALAKEVLPKIQQTHQDILAGAIHTPKLAIAIHCHACFQWLLPVTEQVKKQYPNLTITFIDEHFDEDKKSQPDILFTDDKVDESSELMQNENIDAGSRFDYHPIGLFEMVAAIPKNHQLRHEKHLKPHHFSSETLLTYPVPFQQLDIYQHFLRADKIKPNKIKQIHNSHMILQMVAAEMGITTLPDWLFKSLAQTEFIAQKSLGSKGIHKMLYAKIRKGSTHNHNDLSVIIEQFIHQATHAFAALAK